MFDILMWIFTNVADDISFSSARYQSDEDFVEITILCATSHTAANICSMGRIL